MDGNSVCITSTTLHLTLSYGVLTNRIATLVFSMTCQPYVYFLVSNEHPTHTRVRSILQPAAESEKVLLACPFSILGVKRWPLNHPHIILMVDLLNPI